MNKKVTLFAAGIAACAAFCTSTVAEAAIYVRMPNVPGDVMGPDGNFDWFVADSFSFGVEREMKESGEKGGTEDINIGIGELQECTISKSMDSASAQLAQFAINGNTAGPGEVCFSNSTSAEGRPVCYLKYKLERAYVKSWSISGDADDRPTEEVAFYYNKIAFAYRTDAPDGSIHEDDGNWDQEKNREWEEGLEGIYEYLEGTPPPRDPPSCRDPL